jgi:molybdopterin-guanine dinucleotide biosynthesis protein A
MKPDLGAIIAGGRSRRYGSPKALARVGGDAVIARVARALREAGTEVVVVTESTAVADAAGTRSRGDRIAGLGALGGIHAALRWAEEEDRPGALAVGCDMPFLSPPLLQRILELARSLPGADVVAPEGGGPRMIEPLCAWYGVSCLPAIERAVAREDHRLIGFHADVRVRRIPLDEVTRFGPPERLFLNINSPGDRDRAEALAVEGSGG